jgi:hypothetical protein
LGKLLKQRSLYDYATEIHLAEVISLKLLNLVNLCYPVQIVNFPVFHQLNALVIKTLKYPKTV